MRRGLVTPQPPSRWAAAGDAVSHLVSRFNQVGLAALGPLHGGGASVVYDSEKRHPEAVLSEIYRVLKPDGVVIISFSNRMFYQKAIAVWRDGTDTDRVNLVRSYFQAIDGFTQLEVVVHQPLLPGFLQMLGLAGGDPFYAVIARKNTDN